MPGNPNWKKGQSGNPKGRPPKGHSISEMVRSKLDPEAFAEAILALAYSGDIAAIRTVWHKLEGAPRQEVEHNGDLRTTASIIVLPSNGREMNILDVDQDDD